MIAEQALDAMRDPETLDDVTITAEAREAIWNPTLGIPVTQVKVDFNRLIRLDTLISHPPGSIRSNLAMIGWFDERFDFVRGMFRRAT